MSDYRARMEDVGRVISIIESVAWYTIKIVLLTWLIRWVAVNEIIYSGLAVQLPTISKCLWLAWGFLILLAFVSPIKLGRNHQISENFHVLVMSVDISTFLITSSWHYPLIHILLIIIDQMVTHCIRDNVTFIDDSTYVSYGYVPLSKIEDE